MLAFEEAVVRNENFEVFILIVSKSFRAGEIIANILVWDTKVGRVIEKKKTGIGRVGESGKIIGFERSEAI